MDHAINEWNKTCALVDKKQRVRKVMIERTLVVLGVTVMVDTVVSLYQSSSIIDDSGWPAFFTGLLWLWVISSFQDSCCFEHKRVGLHRRIAKQVVQIVGHSLITLVTLVVLGSGFGIKCHNFAAGVWSACFLLELGHSSQDIEGTVMLWSHFVMLVCSTLSSVHQSTQALMLMSALEIPVCLLKLANLYHNGSPSLNIGLYSFAWLHVGLMMWMWCSESLFQVMFIAHLTNYWKHLASMCFY